MSYLVDWNLQT